jgi:L-iditol 2-dehydrogenase
VKVFRRGYHARMIMPPALFGHELAGDIVATWRRGDAVSRGAAGSGGELGSLWRVFLL